MTSGEELADIRRRLSDKGTCDYGLHHRSIPRVHTRRVGCVNWQPVTERPCSHGEGCKLPWSVHDWSYEAEIEGRRHGK